MDIEARQLSIIDTAVMRYSAQGGKQWDGEMDGDWHGEKCSPTSNLSSDFV